MDYWIEVARNVAREQNITTHAGLVASLMSVENWREETAAIYASFVFEPAEPLIDTDERVCSGLNAGAGVGRLGFGVRTGEMR